MTAEIIELVHKESGTTAKILPDFGFNCFSLQVPSGRKMVEVLWSHPEITSLEQRPSGSGIPLLFPFCGRIAGTTLEYEGNEYQLEEGDGQGNAIHGFVLNRAWRVIQDEEAFAVGEFHASRDDASLLDRWPADFAVRVRYQVADSALRCAVEVYNPDDHPLPFGWGTHPYFRLPIGGAGQVDDTVVTVPAERYWELSELRPTGRLRPATGAMNFTSGTKLGDRNLDDVLTHLATRDGKCTTRLENPANRHAIVQTFDESIGHCVVYTPPHREAICIEPYTCVPDPFRLESRGIETGLALLNPGESFRTKIEIRYRQ
jgi:aldose 1-epimerase